LSSETENGGFITPPTRGWIIGDILGSR